MSWIMLREYPGVSTSKMRGIDYMSASSKKKMRKEQNASAMTEKQQAASKEAKKLRTMTISFIVVIALIFGAFAYITVNGILTKHAVFEKNTIVTNIDGHDLNLIEFTYYYVDAVEAYYNDVYNTYSTSTELFLSTMGLDLTMPLDQQTNTQTGENWFEFFTNLAIENAKSDFALCKLAEADAEFDASEKVASTVSTAKANLNFIAAYSGFGSADTYLRNKYCNGANTGNYAEYVERSTIASEYYNAHLESLSYTDEDYRTYEATRYNKFSSFDFASYTLSYESFLEGGEEGEDGKKTYSDAEKDAARAALKAAAEKLAECTTIEELDAAIAELSFNEGKTVSSNKNTAIHYSSLKEVYGDWLGDAERKAGDMKAFPVETKSTDADGNEITLVNSYTLVMYQSTNANLMKLANVRHLLIKFGTTGKDDNGNAITSEDDKKAAKEEAEKLHLQWLNDGGSEEDLIDLIGEHSDDGYATTGGLFEDIHPDSSYVTNFRNWAVDPERKKGDSEVIETEYGYHIMYFVGHSDMTYRDYTIDNTMKSEAMEEWFKAATDAITVTTKDIGKLDKMVADNLI